MKSSHSLDRVDVAFDDHRLAANAGLLLPATLAQHLGLEELFEEYVDLGQHHAGANGGRKALTLVASALAGGNCVDDVDALRAGGTGEVLGHRVVAPSTLGTWLRAFTWGHSLQVEKVLAEALKRAWSSGAGPGSAPVTIDLDSTICETYGLQKQGGWGFTYSHVRGTIRCWQRWPGPVTSATRGCAGVPRPQPRELGSSSPRPSGACARRGPAERW